MWTRSCSTCEASMNETLGRLRLALEAEYAVAPHRADPAGQVDPLLAVPAGDERVHRDHVLVEGLPCRGACRDRRRPEDTRADGSGQGGERLDREPVGHGGSGPGLIGVAV